MCFPEANVLYSQAVLLLIRCPQIDISLELVTRSTMAMRTSFVLRMPFSISM